MTPSNGPLLVAANTLCIGGHSTSLSHRLTRGINRTSNSDYLNFLEAR